jgi:hypothetical protein
VAVKLLTHVTSAPCVTATEKVLRLSWRIRVMRLIRGTPVHRINPGARINHANRSDSLGRLQGTVTLGAMQTPVTMASPATGYLAGSCCIFMIAKDLVPQGLCRTSRDGTTAARWPVARGSAAPDPRPRPIAPAGRAFHDREQFGTNSAQKRSRS